jgi:glycosyltransferase involved in cell wall biosynthesis
MANLSDSAVIAIVIPLFKHSVLVVDALASAIAQQTRYPFAIVVVNDGCPFQESDLQVKAVQATCPEMIRYVVQRNGGLSAARNTGIEYALKHFPALKAVYLMDADNLILPGAIDAAYTKLMAEPEISWIYPHIDMFGIRRNFDYSGPYSVLKHTQYNICEAGSLVHRRIFDAGIRFDEQMKLGYEDWDFWLTAAARGFKGANHPHFGFRYRNRGESMLSQAHRIDSELQFNIVRKHNSLLGRRSLLRLESEEALRYALVFTDTNEVLLTTGTSDPGSAIPMAEFDEMFWRNIILPTRQHVPPFFAFMNRTTFDLLSRLGLLLWVLHDSEVTLKDKNICCYSIESTTSEAFQIFVGARPSDSDVLVLGRDLVCTTIHSVDTSWVDRIVQPDDEMKVLAKTLKVPRCPESGLMTKGSAAVALLQRIRAWRASPYRAASEKKWIWRELSVPPPHNLYFNVRAAFGGDVVYPLPSTGARNIGFILPLASFGGVERVAYNLARQFAREGWKVHLFVIGQTHIEIPAEFSQSMSSINFLNDSSFGGWDPESEYQGTALPTARNRPRATSRIVAALAWLDAIVNCHSGELNAAAAELRRLGVKTAAHLHLLDLSPNGRPVGHPMITLAYEHAYDLIVCNSEHLRSWMHAAGIPHEKLLHVPNAPGHAVDPSLRERILAKRTSLIPKRLDVLYIGRLDRQKGMERLAEVVKQSRELDLGINWRIVGSSVTRDCRTPPVLQEMLEPAVFDGQRLTELYGWADVMILLSEFEGIPLSVLEAQRLGVVVIATNVGALPEVITSGANGFLVERETAVEQTLGLLRLLAEVPALRSRIAANASNVIDWQEASFELIDKMAALVDSSENRMPPLRTAPAHKLDAATSS